MSDVSTTPRRPMSPMRRLRIWEAHGGICILCRNKIDGARGVKWTVEHIRPLGLGGADEDANCGPAHETCRLAKDRHDMTSIAKAKRMKARHLGIRKAPAFRSKWRKKMNGEVVLR